MSAPYRELFVELPAALLDILRGIVDGQMQRIEHVHQRPSIALALCEALEDGPSSRVLCKRYGWEQIAAGRSAVERCLDILCVRPCRYLEHCPSFKIRDNTLEDVAAPMMRDLILQMFERAARGSCYCVAPPRMRHRAIALRERSTERG